MWMVTVVRKVTDTYWNWEILKQQKKEWCPISDNTSEDEAKYLANELIKSCNSVTEDERLHLKLVRIYKTH